MNDRVDPLLDCLVELTRLHGRSMTHSVLLAGLPIKEQLTPSLFSRAAARAGFATRIVKMSLKQINAKLMPAVLLLKNNRACVLLSIDQVKKTAKVLMPETGQGEIKMKFAELVEEFENRVIFSRPRFRLQHQISENADIVRKGRHWFWSAFFEQKSLYRDVFLGALLINIFAVITPIFTMNVYDRVIPTKAEETLWMLGVGVLAVILFDYILKTIRAYFVDLAGSRIDVKLSGLIMERVLGMRLEDKPLSVGSFANTLRSFESIRDFVSSATVATLIDFPFAILFLVVIGWIAWPLLLIPVTLFLIITIRALIVKKQVNEATEEIYRTSALRNSILIEALGSIETLKSFGGEGVIQKKWEGIAAQLAKLNSSTRLKNTSITGMVGTASSLCLVGNIILGVYLIDLKMLTMGGLIACSMLVSRFIGPLAQLVNLMMQYENAKLSFEMLSEQMKKPQERSNDINYVYRENFEGNIEFKNVNFQYPNEDELAINNITLKINKGEHVGIIGKTGSGKTTITRLMQAMYAPTTGSVRMDGIDLRQIDPSNLRSHIGAVEQNTVLYFGSLRDNITMGAPYVEDSQIIEAADIAMLADLVNQHPRGFDLLVGERGEFLSGGQRQSVGIARAVLQSPQTLILDEPTSAMDLHTENQFIQKLNQFKPGKTLVLVSHRLTLLALVDRLIVMDQGKIIADGPRDVILERFKKQPSKAAASNVQTPIKKAKPDGR